MATIIVERLRTVETLATAGTGEAIPELARLERQASGWGCIALAGVLGFAAAAVLLLALSALLFGWGTLVIQLLAYLLRQLAPRSADSWLAIMLLATAIIVFFSARWRTLMQDETLWQHTRARNATGYAHLAVSALVRAGMTLLAASFLPFTLFAPVYVLTQWRSLSAPALAALRTMLPADWGFVVAWLPFVLLALAPFLFVDWKQRAPRRRMIGLAFLLCGYLTVVWLLFSAGDIRAFARDTGARWPLQSGTLSADDSVRGWAVVPLLLAAEMLEQGLAWLLAYGSFWRPLVVFLALGLTYPLGLSYVAARIFYLPYALFRNTWGYIAERARLRRRTSHVLNDHIGRNKQRVRGDGWGTVCSVHLQRFTEAWAWRSYLRSVSYHLCPVCHRDTHTYNNVACVSVLLDDSMTDPVCRRGNTLYLNGLWWSEKPGQAVEGPFESLVIGPADHLAIEQFVIHCEAEPSLWRALQTAPCHVVADHPLHDNTRNMLLSKLREITSGFSLTDTAVPCRPAMRQREVGKRHLRRGLRVLLVLLVVAALLVATGLAVLWLWVTLLG